MADLPDSRSPEGVGGESQETGQTWLGNLKDGLGSEVQRDKSTTLS